MRDALRALPEGATTAWVRGTDVRATRPTADDAAVQQATPETIDLDNLPKELAKRPPTVRGLGMSGGKRPQPATEEQGEDACSTSPEKAARRGHSGDVKRER